ncbi:hypothetical protein [Serratia plymuthica]|uniref:hypothetical protein n=1 Tax=Serratia plymuthica TaxID=82996 RepID=UPI001E63FEE0|nr:hypothetical protein [Serratia plymuthica]UNK25812.1 hypothetical protein MNO11_13155 [Serratia plymuthica]
MVIARVCKLLHFAQLITGSFGLLVFCPTKNDCPGCTLMNQSKLLPEETVQPSTVQVMGDKEVFFNISWPAITAVLLKKDSINAKA